MLERRQRLKAGHRVSVTEVGGFLEQVTRLSQITCVHRKRSQSAHRLEFSWSTITRGQPDWPALVRAALRSSSLFATSRSSIRRLSGRGRPRDGPPFRRRVRRPRRSPVLAPSVPPVTVDLAGTASALGSHVAKRPTKPSAMSLSAIHRHRRDRSQQPPAMSYQSVADNKVTRSDGRGPTSLGQKLGRPWVVFGIDRRITAHQGISWASAINSTCKLASGWSSWLVLLWGILISKFLSLRVLRHLNTKVSRGICRRASPRPRLLRLWIERQRWRRRSLPLLFDGIVYQ